MEITNELIRFICSTNYGDYSIEVAESTKKNIMNILGISLAGSSAATTKKIAGMVKKWGGVPESTVIAYDNKAPAHEAAMVNGTMARVLNLDEVHPPTGAHPFATIVPAALAVAEIKGNINGKEFLNAVTIGSEIVCRMRSVPDFCLGVSGWVSEIYSVFGAALAAGRLLGLGENEMSDAMGLAYSQAGGTAQAVYDGAAAYQVQQGFAARSGIVASLMAAEGISGSRNFLEGKAGLYPVYYRGMTYDITRLLKDIGKTYLIEKMFIRSYPVSGFLQAPVENAVNIMQENNLLAEEIENIAVRVNKRMYRHVCIPADNKYRPKSIIDAMFSMPYVVGNVIAKGILTSADFSIEAIQESDRLNAAKKVKIFVDEEIDKESIDLGLSVSLHLMELKMKDGRVFSKKMYYAKGSPQKPFTFEDCVEKSKKLIHLCIKSFDEKKIYKLGEIVKNLEHQKSLDSLINLLR